MLVHVCVVIVLLGGCFFRSVLSTSKLSVVVIMTFPQGIELRFGPVVATMQSSLEADCRALAIACFTLIATFFGSFASYMIGVIYDHLLANGSPDSVVKWLVLWSVVASYGSSTGLDFTSGIVQVNPNFKMSLN